MEVEEHFTQVAKGKLKRWILIEFVQFKYPIYKAKFNLLQFINKWSNLSVSFRIEYCPMEGCILIPEHWKLYVTFSNDNINVINYGVYNKTKAQAMERAKLFLDLL